MFELKAKVPAYRHALCDTYIGVNNSIQQVNIFTDTITLLRKKILQLEQELVETQYSAYHDELTGLANRGLLRDRLSQAINQAARHHKHVGLLLLDLNGFKHVNDILGHNIGDNLLKRLAKRLVSCIRSADSAYRYGGDEFVILLPEVDDRQGATELMWKLYAHLAKPYFLCNQSLVVSASIGIAIYPDDGMTQHELIKRADISMYLAKTKNSHLSPNTLTSSALSKSILSKDETSLGYNSEL